MNRKRTCAKDYEISPLTGVLDTRTLPGEMGDGTWRWRQNFDITAAGRLCRMEGWRKLLGDVTPYNNHDLHDQLCGEPTGTTNLQTYYEQIDPAGDDSSVTSYPPNPLICGTDLLQRETGRQPITFLFEVVSSSGQRRMLAGTQNRLYALNEVDGNWKLIADAYGGTPKAGLPERRWKAAQLGDAVMFTNNQDDLFVWLFDQPASGCGQQSVTKVPELVEIGVRKAGAIVEWKGCLFLGNVEMDGQRVESRVVWCNEGNIFSWVPALDSVAGYEDLGYGQKILAMQPLGNYLLIYTNKGIWQAEFVGGEQVFNFREIYADKQGAACLLYPNTLVSTGEAHVYLSADGIYQFTPFLPKPERNEWLHAASAPIFDTINERVCEAHVAFHDSKSKRILISWVETGQTFPSRTLMLNTRYGFASYIDHGFTAFGAYTSDRRPTVRSFLLQNCICTPEELADSDIQGIIPSGIKEGGLCTGPAASEDCEGVPRNTPIFTDAVREIDGRFVEDWQATSASAGSLCKLMEAAGFSLEDLCVECNAEKLLVMASARDWCLKQFGEVYFREYCTGMTGCGTYAREGYESVQRSGPIDFGQPQVTKLLSKLVMEYEARQQVTPNNLFLKIGRSSTPSEPNTGGNCPILWNEQQSRPLVCENTTSEDEHKQAGTRPNKDANWPLYLSGQYLYLQFSLGGIGGASCFAGLRVEVKAMK